MSAARITPNQWTILEALERGDIPAVEFALVRPLVEDLAERGFVIEVGQTGGSSSSTVLTEAGREILAIGAAA